jgi:hypothetical protein
MTDRIAISITMGIVGWIVGWIVVASMMTPAQDGVTRLRRIARWFGHKLKWLGIGIGVLLLVILGISGWIHILSMGPIGIVILLLFCILFKGN